MTTLPTPADPELERLLVEEDIIDIERQIAAAHNNLTVAQAVIQQNPYGSTDRVAAETEVEVLCLYIEGLEVQLQTTQTTHNQLSIECAQNRQLRLGK